MSGSSHGESIGGRAFDEALFFDQGHRNQRQKTVHYLHLVPMEHTVLQSGLGLGLGLGLGAPVEHAILAGEHDVNEGVLFDSLLIGDGADVVKEGDEEDAVEPSPWLLQTGSGSGCTPNGSGLRVRCRLSGEWGWETDCTCPNA